MTDASQDKLALIFGRRSVRVYSPGEVTTPEIDKLLAAAMAAPSAMTKDPWRFIVVRNPDTLGRLAALLPGGKMLASVPVAIVACGDLEAAFEQNIGYLLQDCSASIQNLLLAAHGLGLGACWVGVYPAQDSMNQLKALFSMPASIIPVAVVAIGRPGEELPARTRYNAAAIHREKW